MKAIRLHKFGDPSGFQLDETPEPVPADGEMLVRVEASSVNPIDLKIRSGAVPAVSPELPAVLHGDVVGVIEAVGPAVRAFKAGQRIWACAGGLGQAPGAIAEKMIVDSRLAGVAPDGLSPVEAAALPLVGVTAYIAVHDRAEVRPGQNVLVHGGTGGVGHVVVQLVKALGARVTATVSTEAKREAAASLGADEVLLREDTPENQFETVIDTIGGANLSHSFRQVVTNGRVVTIAARTTADLTPLHGKNATFHAVFMGLPLITGVGRERHGAIMGALREMVEAGQLRPLVGNRFDFEELAAAHRALEKGELLGKIVLEGFAN